MALEAWWREQVRSRSPAWRWLLGPLSLAYGLGLRLRRAALPSRPPRRLAGAKVVSVGNVSVGGTGKTPLGLALARSISQRRKVAVVLRGYRGRPQSLPLLVSRGQGALAGVSESGDEAQLYASLPGVAVVVDPDRLRGAQFAAAELGCKVILLDDGFQRRWQLARDLEIVVLDRDQLFAPWLLPKGPYREPLEAAAGADALVVTGGPKGLSREAQRRELPASLRHLPFFPAQRRSAGLRAWPCGKRLGLRALRGRTVAALSGIGSPQGFEAALLEAGAHAVVRWRYRDHHAYRREDLASPPPAQAIVTTAKDAVRLPKDWRPSLPVWVLEMDLKPAAGQSWAQLLKLMDRP